MSRIEELLKDRQRMDYLDRVHREGINNGSYRQLIDGEIERAEN